MGKGPLTDDEKKRRKERAKRRREAKAKGTYVPRSERKRKLRAAQQEAVEVKVLRHRDRSEIEKVVKKRRDDEPRRLHRRFKTQEPVLIKAKITGQLIHDDHGRPQYYVTPITDFGQKGGTAWLIHEGYLVPWPRKSKKGR